MPTLPVRAPPSVLKHDLTNNYLSGFKVIADFPKSIQKREKESLRNRPIIDAPKWLAECQEKNSASPTNSKACSTRKLPEVIKEGQRNRTLFRYACGLVQSFSPEEVLARLRAINTNRCEPPMEDSEIAVIHRSAEKWRKK
jgi:hypothetical protein